MAGRAGGGVAGPLAPVFSHWLRPRLPERGFDSPSWGQLVDDPLGMLAELTFTGYYPAVPWLAYLLVGMAVGRLDLTHVVRRPRWPPSARLSPSLRPLCRAP